MTNPLVLRILSLSVEVSKQAGVIIKDTLNGGDLAIIDKGINDLQTLADRRAQNCIITSLSKHFPNITIIGEETLDPNDKIDDKWIVNSFDETVFGLKCPKEWLNVDDKDVVVWVDPLDGTSEFTQGRLDHVMVLIGLAVKGRAIGGVIHQPFFNYNMETDYSKLGRTLWGLVGLGAFGISPKRLSETKVYITTTRSHSNEIIDKTVAAMKPDEVLRVGGAGNKILIVAEGNAHAFVFPSRSCKKWDTCAPQAILESLGGKLTDMLGNDLNYDKNVDHTNELGVLATHSLTAHQLFCSRVPEDVKQNLISNQKKL